MSWSDIFLPDGTQTYDEAQENYSSIQKKLYDQTQAKRAAGTLTADEEIERNRIAGLQLSDQNAETAAGFKEGLQDGLDNIRGTIGGTLNGVFSAIPWQLWLVLVVAALFWLGVHTRLRRAIAS